MQRRAKVREGFCRPTSSLTLGSEALLMYCLLATSLRKLREFPFRITYLMVTALSLPFDDVI